MDTARSDIRQQLAALGNSLPVPLWRVLQAFLTWVTGKPHQGQIQLFTFTPFLHLVLTLLCMGVGVALSVYAVRVGSYGVLLLPTSLTLTISSQRKVFLSLVHATLHNTFFKSRRANRLLAEALTLLIFTQPYRRLLIEHVRKHHGRAFCTAGDPDALALYTFGMRPGMERQRLWRSFLKTLVSPRFHLLFAWMRLKSSLVDSSPLRRACVVLILIGVPWLVHSLHAWPEFLVCWLLPVFPGFQMVALISFAGEHRWFRLPASTSRRRPWFFEQTQGRFVAPALPDPDLHGAGRFFRWVLWWFLLLTWHLPLRLLIIPCDMPAHDHHHVHVQGEWANAIYARQRRLEAGAPYTETWGVFRAIDLLFQDMSLMAPVKVSGKLPAYALLQM